VDSIPFVFERGRDGEAFAVLEEGGDFTAAGGAGSGINQA
jgi:hypothetical protein